MSIVFSSSIHASHLLNPLSSQGFRCIYKAITAAAPTSPIKLPTTCVGAAPDEDFGAGPPDEGEAAALGREEPLAAAPPLYCAHTLSPASLDSV
jgi:hypothetical protein